MTTGKREEEGGAASHLAALAKWKGGEKSRGGKHWGKKKRKAM